MKLILSLLIIGLALALCNLSSKFRNASNTTESNDTPATATDSGGAAIEHATPTAAQTAALEGGQEIKWDQQGMSWTVPPKWTEATNESKMFVWRSPGSWDAANLIVNISTMDESFPTDVSLNAFYDSAKTRAKNGEVDELKWVEIDGLKGVQFRESNPEREDGIRRLQWLAYRKYAGQVQMVNLMLSSSGKGFPKQQDAMYGILYSTKIVH
jgi:hypothetical protein